MTDVPDPVDIERQIQDVRERIDRGAAIINERLKVYQAARLTYDVAFATAFAEHRGPQSEKRQKAVLATVDEAKVRDEAFAALQYAKDRSSDLRAELRALQSIGASVRASFGAAGYGR